MLFNHRTLWSLDCSPYVRGAIDNCSPLTTAVNNGCSPLTTDCCWQLLLTTDCSIPEVLQPWPSRAFCSWLTKLLRFMSIKKYGTTSYVRMGWIQLHCQEFRKLWKMSNTLVQYCIPISIYYCTKSCAAKYPTSFQNVAKLGQTLPHSMPMRNGCFPWSYKTSKIQKCTVARSHIIS